jgi:Mn-dependent DtxR family transcriptional regulator
MKGRGALNPPQVLYIFDRGFGDRFYLGNRAFGGPKAMARTLELTENVEMYLKYIHLLYQQSHSAAKTGEISHYLDVAPSSVTEMLERLEKDGLVKYRKYQGATLTKRGREIAVKILRRHCTMEYFLVQALRVPEGRYHNEACEMEHVLSEDTTRRLQKLIDQPATCPDCYDLSRLHCKYLAAKA